SYSNYGATTVDVGAPGDSIQTTARGNRYNEISGSSPATAIVAGIAALVEAQCRLDTAKLKATILSTVDLEPGLSGKTVTGGRVNADAAVRRCAAGNQAPDVSITDPADGAHFTAPASIRISADAGDADGTVAKVDFYANGVRIATDSSAPYS